jgi:thiol-disulfide isomerase/thioredoxin
MKTLTVLSVMFALLAGSAPLHAAPPVPDWTLSSSEGESVRLSTEVRQQPVVLFFWATWCPYCKALMPHLQSIRLEYGDQVKILAINFAEKGDPIGFMQQRGYDFTLLPDGDEIATINGVFGTPGVILVDQKQQIRFDLRTLPQLRLRDDETASGHQQKAAFLAPYWAAELRKSIDAVLQELAE